MWDLKPYKEEKIGSNVFDIGHWMFFLDMPLRWGKQKQKYYWDFIKLKSFRTMKKTTKAKRQHTGGGERWWKCSVPKSPSPRNYLDNLQIILKIYEFSLRFKQRPVWMLQWKSSWFYKGRKTGKRNKETKGIQGWGALWGAWLWPGWVLTGQKSSVLGEGGASPIFQGRMATSRS